MNVFTSYPHLLYKSKKTSGFTIVELLIVIVVIAILAAISIVSYNNIQARAKNAARLTMAENTIKLLELYKATYGEYPKLEADRGYCVGTGYPKQRCRSDSYPYSELDITLSAELKKVGTIPTGNYNEISGESGPYVYTWRDGTAFGFFQPFDKSVMTGCPSTFTGTWIAPNNNLMICSKNFYYST
ncbi:MAG: type II secretion system protein [Candidatus Saccharimonas sp.]